MKQRFLTVHHGGVQMQVGLYLPRIDVQAENLDLQGENHWDYQKKSTRLLKQKVKIYLLTIIDHH